MSRPCVHRNNLQYSHGIDTHKKDAYLSDTNPHTKDTHFNPEQNWT